MYKLLAENSVPPLFPRGAFEHVRRLGGGYGVDRS